MLFVCTTRYIYINNILKRYAMQYCTVFTAIKCNKIYEHKIAFIKIRLVKTFHC